MYFETCVNNIPLAGNVPEFPINDDRDLETTTQLDVMRGAVSHPKLPAPHTRVVSVSPPIISGFFKMPWMFWIPELFRTFEILRTYVQRFFKAKGRQYRGKFPIGILDRKKKTISPAQGKNPYTG